MFFSSPNLLIRAGLKAEDFNDDVLGRLNHTEPPREYLLWHRSGIRWRKTAMDRGLFRESFCKRGEDAGKKEKERERRALRGMKVR